MRRPSYDQSPSTRIGRRIRSDAAHTEIYAWRPRQLRRNSTADEGWTHQVEGLPQGIWWLRRSPAGVEQRGPALPGLSCSSAQTSRMAEFGGLGTSFNICSG